MKRLVLASSNPGKLAELRALLADQDMEISSAADWGVGDIEENGASFVENALLKARHVCRISACPALADDSGLLVDALGGKPGLHTARFAGPGADASANMDKLLGLLDGVADADRGAEFIAVIVLLRHPEDPAPWIAEGRWRGHIARERLGLGGFGYDPVFVPDGSALSAAEMSAADKQLCSHRALALRSLRALWARGGGL